jgi:general stress protein 26
MSVLTTERFGELKKIADIISGIHFAVLTTLEPDGTLHSRPMTTQQVEFDGDLWFFTNSDSPKAWETNQHRQVNVASADPGKGKYFSASGTATLSYDRAKMKELWNLLTRYSFRKVWKTPTLRCSKSALDAPNIGIPLQQP